MILHCRWLKHQELGILSKLEPCPIPPTELIVYGCLNEHLGEIPLCDFHAGMWMGAQKGKKVGCSRCTLTIDYWNAAGIYLLHETYTPTADARYRYYGWE